MDNKKYEIPSPRRLEPYFRVGGVRLTILIQGGNAYIYLLKESVLSDIINYKYSKK
jgi:hypothetical protein